MCGRFTLTYRRAELLAAELGVPVESLTDYRVRTRHEDREILPARWGLMNFWMTDRKQAFKNINARAETARKLPSFRAAFAERRCVIPADGFFEWTGPKENRQPIWFHRSDGGLILFAGLYDSWRPNPAEKERTFTIITTAPNALLAPIHNRMPAILDEGAVDDWLYAHQSPDSLMQLLRPVREDFLVATPASPQVNSVKNDDPECFQAEVRI